MEKQVRVVRLNFYDLILLIAKWYKLFIANIIIVVLVSVIIALTLPVYFSSSVVILPPSGGSSGIPSYLPSNLKGVAANFGLDLPTDEIYQTILRSTSLKENIIERFNLKEVYDVSDDVFPEDLIKAFGSHMEISTRDDNAIVITIEDKSPELSTEIARGCVEELDNLFRKLTSEKAHRNRVFIGRRLQQIQDSLASLQDSIAAFQTENHTVSISEQMLSTINTAADIKALQISTEVELEVLMNTFGRKHPQISQLTAKSKELAKRYSALIDGSEGDMFLDMSELPSLNRNYAELLRKAKIQNSLIEFIYPQFESARIKEMRESGNIQVIDIPRIPSRKSRPPRKLIVMVAAFGSFIATLVLVLLLEYWRMLPKNNQEDWDKVEQIKAIFRKH